MTKDNELRQYLELTNDGFIRYTLIKFNLVSEQDTILFSTQKKISEPITKDSELDQSSQNEIGLFVIKVAQFAHNLKRMPKYADQLNRITVILPSEITTLKSQTIDASSLQFLNSNSLKVCLDKNIKAYPQQMRIIVEDKSVVVDGTNYRFSDPNIPSEYKSATIISLNAYAKLSYAKFLKDEINREFQITPVFISKGNVLKKDLIISQNANILNVNQSKIIFDWGLDSTNIEVDQPNDKERFQIPFGINSIVKKACETLGIDSELNRRLMLNTYLKQINIASLEKNSVFLRTTNDDNQIIELTNTELKRVISDSVSAVINDAVKYLVTKNNIDVAADAQKFHLGLLPLIKGLKETYKVIDYTHGLNNYIVESNYADKFNGIYSADYYSAFVLAKNEKARMKSDINKQQRMRTDALIFSNPQQFESRPSLMKQKEFVKKVKVDKN